MEEVKTVWSEIATAKIPIQSLTGRLSADAIPTKRFIKRLTVDFQRVNRRVKWFYSSIFIMLLKILSEESGEVAKKSLSHSSSVDVAFSQRGQAIVLTPSRGFCAAFDTFQNVSIGKKIR